jgi:hypothetical protein
MAGEGATIFDGVRTADLYIQNIRNRGAGEINMRNSITMVDATNISLGTTTGTEIGTATGQKLGFWGVTPVVQPIAATGGGMTVDQLITILQTTGIIKQS